jgi:hypothetical protein
MPDVSHETIDVPGLWNDIAVALAKEGRMAAACAAQRRAVDLAPDRADLQSNYGNMLRRYGRDYALAYHHLRSALRLDPNHNHAWHNMGVWWLERGSTPAALSCLGRALEDDPTNHDWKFARATGLLMAERWTEGFEAYECRYEGKDLGTTKPLWDGSPLKGRTLLLHAEQGYGDTIMFHRYAHWLATKERTINYIVPQPLVRLLRGSRESGELLPSDVHLPLMSLPHVLGINKVEAPPYIAPPFQLVIKEPPGTKYRIGLVWKAKSGRSEMTVDEQLHGLAKTMPFELLLELTSIPQAHLFALQPGADDVDKAGAGHLVTDLGPRIHDFADLSSFIQQLDVLVSVDTAPAHLAGAMGKPAVVCCAYAHNWNWGTRDRSPWYDSARIVRQAEPGVWPIQRIIEKVRECLQSP